MIVHTICIWCKEKRSLKFVPDCTFSGDEPVQEITTHTICQKCSDQLLKHIEANAPGLQKMVDNAVFPTKDGSAKPID